MIEVSTAAAVLEWVATWFGVAGAALVALQRPPWSGIGFVFFLLSNFAWITYGNWTTQEGLTAQHIAFTATSLLGLLRARWSAPGAAEPAGDTPND